jgi:hypothetical protein
MLRFVLAALVLALAGCQPVPHPFADNAQLPGSPALRPPDSAGILVEEVTGAPAPAATSLAAALAAALRDGDVPASTQGHNRGSFRLATAVATQTLGPAQTAITLDWQLLSAAGKIVGTGTARRDGPSTLWNSGDSGLAAKLAGDAAPAIVRLVAGDAPAASAVEAAVAVGSIAGAPGDGGTALARAIALTLGRAGVDVAAGTAKGRFTLSCRVEIRPQPDGKQRVIVRWTLSSATGAKVGEVTQDNTLPAGALDGSWGDIAFAVASAAAPGIAQLVEHASVASVGG